MEVVLGRYNTVVNKGSKDERLFIVKDKENFENMINIGLKNLDFLIAEYGNPNISDGETSHEFLKRNLEINLGNVFCKLYNIRVVEEEQDDPTVEYPIMKVIADADIGEEELPFEPSFALRALCTKELKDGLVYNNITNVISWDLRTDINQTTKEKLDDSLITFLNTFNNLNFKYKITITGNSNSLSEDLENLLVSIKTIVGEDVDDPDLKDLYELIASKLNACIDSDVESGLITKDIFDGE